MFLFTRKMPNKIYLCRIFTKASLQKGAFFMASAYY